MPDCSHRDVVCKACGADGIHFFTAQPQHVEVVEEVAPKKHPILTGILLALVTVVLLDAFKITHILANIQYLFPDLQYVLKALHG